MTWSNHDDVIAQMRGLGLIIDGIDTGRMRRCKVEDDRERRGWYMLHELRLDDGDTVLVGSYGVWHGNENNAQKIELGKLRKLTADQKTALRKRMADDKKRVDAERARMAQIAARRAKQVWDKLAPDGSCQYLDAKGVKAYGLRFSDSGCAYLPLLDANGAIHGLQILLPRGHKRIEQTGRNKDFWPAGLVKKGHWFQIGTVRDLVLIAEGYATAASIHEATGLPIAVAFDAGNLLPVAEALKKRHRSARILICADDDFKSEGNPGMTAASTAALAVKGAVIAPVFTIDREVGKKGLTDFNDLHLGEGLHTVRAQVEKRLDELQWRAEAKSRAGDLPQGGGERVALKSMLTIDEALERFAMVYGGKGTFYDAQECALVPKVDVLDVLPEHGWRDMRAGKIVVRMAEVGFEPSMPPGIVDLGIFYERYVKERYSTGVILGINKNHKYLCNLWGGWPTTPKQGRCDILLELLEYLCSEEEGSRAAFEWVLKWIAYPIQHPGAKMRTALIFHGPQGTGKNLIFEAVMAIYGEYGRIVDQAAVEDKFNDWASKKLFMIADEVVARQELYHVKNKLKCFVTGEWIRINPKNVAAHDEKNHVNLVFLSNESQPLVLEKDDRRYAVIHTPEKLGHEFYQQCRDEINNGGIAALHHYLLNLDLGDFDEHTKPPMTRAKQDLIEVSLDSVQRFLLEWKSGEVILQAGDPAPYVPCLGAHLFALYRKWCDHSGERSPRSIAQFIGAIRNMPKWRAGQPLQTYERQNGSTIKSRKMVIPPDEHLATSVKCPQKDGKTQAIWLTECFFIFANAGEFQ